MIVPAVEMAAPICFLFLTCGNRSGGRGQKTCISRDCRGPRPKQTTDTGSQDRQQTRADGAGRWTNEDGTRMGGCGDIRTLLPSTDTILLGNGTSTLAARVPSVTDTTWPLSETPRPKPDFSRLSLTRNLPIGPSCVPSRPWSRLSIRRGYRWTRQRRVPHQPFSCGERQWSRGRGGGGGGGGVPGGPGPPPTQAPRGSLPWLLGSQS